MIGKSMDPLARKHLRVPAPKGTRCAANMVAHADSKWVRISTVPSDADTVVGLIAVLQKRYKRGARVQSGR